jgi:hypothetical protein
MLPEVLIMERFVAAASSKVGSRLLPAPATRLDALTIRIRPPEAERSMASVPIGNNNPRRAIQNKIFIIVCSPMKRVREEAITTLLIKMI